LSRFFARRIRRLLPASALVIAAVIFASWLILPPFRMLDVGHDALAASTYVANFRFAAEGTDYLQSQLSPSPLLHYWSLAVEEQFYLLWPALMVLVAGRLRGRGVARRARSRILGRRVTVLLLALFAGSLALSLWLTPRSQPSAFFLLPTRVWELALGALLAVGARTLARIHAPVKDALGWVGLAMVLLAAVLYSDTTLYPGSAALLPVVGTAALIVGSSTRRSSPGVVLAPAPMQWLGARSYVLYLWHWPVLVLAAAWAGHALSVGENVLLCVGALVLAMVTHVTLEDPVHRSAVLADRPKTGLLLGLCITAATVGLAIGAIQLVPDLTGAGAKASTAPLERHSAARTSLEAGLAVREVPVNLDPSLSEVQANDDLPRTYSTCHLGFAEIAPPSCVFGDPRSDVAVVLFGDSHAYQWFPALEALARSNGWRFVSLTKATCPAARVTVYSTALKRTYRECDSWRRRAIERIRMEQPVIVLASSADRTPLAGDQTDTTGAWRRGTIATVEDLAAASRHVVLLGDTPRPELDVPSCLSEHLSDARRCVTSRARAVNEPFRAIQQDVARATGARFIDPTSWVCADAGCPVIVGNTLVYRDGSHLSSRYARAIAPLLERALDELVDATQPGA
jgi:peptidoglycan/LPS O-acetylase OafA/YrhL